VSRAGVVLCRCNTLIDSKMDFNTIERRLQKHKNIVFIQRVNMACSPAGKQIIEEMASLHGIDSLVAVACSPLAKGSVFKDLTRKLGIDKNMLEIVNIREQCAWVHEYDDATSKGLTLINMGISRVVKAQPDSTTINCAMINKIKCDKCKRCLEECPNRAISINDDGYPAVNPDLCQRCGVCIGGCPLAVISLPDFKVDEISPMLKGASGAKSPFIVGFFCDFAYEEADKMGQAGFAYSPNLHIIRVPCTGAVNMITVNDAIAEGVDGVLIAGCDASQCKRKRGNEVARYRIENFQKSLEEQFLEKERLSYVSLGEGLKEASIINDDKCNGCGACQQVCPYGAIKQQDEGKFQVYYKACRSCGICAAACKPGAILVPVCPDKKIMNAIDAALAI